MYHEIGVRSRVEGILAAADIVASIVDTEDFVAIEFVLQNNDLVKLFRRKNCLIAIINISEKPSQKV